MEPQAELDKYLPHLRALPFVNDVRFVQVRPRARQRPAVEPDAIAVVRTARRVHRFRVDLKKTHLTYTLVEGFIARAKATPGDPWLLFAPYIPPKIGRILDEAQICYIDEPGNCRIAIGNDHIAVIEGRKQARKATRGRGMGLPGHQVLFALLADPNLLNLPLRNVAAIAGVGKTAVTHTLHRLEADGFIARGARRRHLLDHRLMLERWLAGYANLVRPRMVLGTFHVPHNTPEETERAIEKALAGRDVNWAWGGGAAAMRLTKHYRGTETVLHVQNPPYNLPQLLRAIPGKDGRLTILRTAGDIAYKGAVPGTVHPLLVYTELLAASNERAREAAEEIRRQYLGDET